MSNDLLGTVKACINNLCGDIATHKLALAELHSNAYIWLRALVTRCEQAEASYQEAQVVIEGLRAERDHYRTAAAGLRQRHAELDGQIDRLAKFIIAEVPGEPSQSQGAVDTAIRVIRELRQRHAEAVEAAYRTGFSDRKNYCYPESQPGEADAAWLASEAKARLT